MHNKNLSGNTWTKWSFRDYLWPLSGKNEREREKSKKKSPTHPKTSVKHQKGYRISISRSVYGLCEDRSRNKKTQYKTKPTKNPENPHDVYTYLTPLITIL